MLSMSCNNFTALTVFNIYWLFLKMSFNNKLSVMKLVNVKIERNEINTHMQQKRETVQYIYAYVFSRTNNKLL